MFIVESWGQNEVSGKTVFDEFMIINEAGKEVEVKRGGEKWQGSLVSSKRAK